MKRMKKKNEKLPNVNRIKWQMMISCESILFIHRMANKAACEANKPSACC